MVYRDPAGGKTVTLRVRKIEDSDLGPTFVALSDFVFDTGNLIIDPEEEDLKKKLAETRRLHLSIYSVLSIEERGGRGLGIRQDRSNLVFLPPDRPGPRKDG